jgi:hypothetical protein
MRDEDLFESALAARVPDRALWEVAARLLDTGTGHQALLDELDSFRLRLRSGDREGDEDRVLDVMDCVAGWCGPEWSLASRGR